MRSPRLSVPLDLEVAREEPDGAGGRRRTWQAIGRIWAEMHAGNGRDRVAGVGTENLVAWRVIVRSAPLGDPRRPLPGQRLGMVGALAVRRFLVRSVAELDPEGRYLLCIAHEETGE